MDKQKDAFFMRKALVQAELALKINEVPVGAIVVDKNGNVIGRGYNKIEKNGCQCAHAEIIAIQKACKKIGDWRLDDCWIYVTLEPCLMCLGLIQLSRLKGVVFGARSEFLGSGFKKKEESVFFVKNLVVRGGLKEIESADIIKRFFKKIRLKRKGKYEKEKRAFRKST